MSDDLPVLPSDRSISELRSKADELRKMAQTASTADAQSALRKLADRFAALADRRAANRTANGQVAAAD